MSGGLFGLLDHVAVLARLAAASIDDIGAAAGRATAKAAGVVIDDTAVTPQYVHRITAERELPIIKRIAIGSVRNKLLLILPGALLLSQLVPWLLTPLLMLGATYLCYEGAEKVCGVIGGRGHDAAPQVAERELVAGAIRTDFILSAEIMVIALNEVADPCRASSSSSSSPSSSPPRCTVSSPSSSKWTTSACASPRPRPDSGSGSAGAWSRGCPNCYRRCQRSGWEPCSGWAAT